MKYPQVWPNSYYHWQSYSSLNLSFPCRVTAALMWIVWHAKYAGFHVISPQCLENFPAPCGSFMTACFVKWGFLFVSQVVVWFERTGYINFINSMWATGVSKKSIPAHFRIRLVSRLTSGWRQKALVKLYFFWFRENKILVIDHSRSE